jgi:hypothetical protein
VDHLVASLPAAARPSTTVGTLGNDVGVMPVALPVLPDRRTRLEVIAARTRRAKESGRGLPPGLVDGVSRLLAHLGLIQPVIDHQRLVNTFVSNLRGPGERLSLFGWPISAIVPVTQTMGNVTTAFCVFSYAGTLSVTVVADPQRCPDDDHLATVLAEELRAYTTALAPV